MTGERERLPRLLALVPYLQARPGVPLAQVATDFDSTEDQIRRDLQLLWMCGLPGHGPGDLIDLSFEGESVDVIFDAGMSRPLRLTSEEALALVVALRTLAETPGLTDRDAIEGALAKVESAAGGELGPTQIVAVELDEVSTLAPTLQHAIDDGRAVELNYYTATRDEITERVVDPMRLFEADGRSYLEAWCRRAEGMRVFRLDRIERATVLPEPSRPPAEAELRDLSEGVFTAAAEHLLVVLRLGPAYWWVADYYPTEESVMAGDNRQISLRVADPAWVRSLVLGSAGQVEVLDPPWLADAIAQESVRALARYGG